MRLLVGSVVKGLRPAFLGAGLPSPGEWPSSARVKDYPSTSTMCKDRRERGKLRAGKGKKRARGLRERSGEGEEKERDR